MEREFYLGQSRDGNWIFAQLTITPGNPEKTMTYTDHHVGPNPTRVSVCFTVVDGARSRPTTTQLAHVQDRWILSSGQTPPEGRVIDAPAGPHTRVIEQAWLDWHLNDMHAECDHMTEEMLTPTEEQLDAYIASHPGADRYGRKTALQGWRIDTVVCPVTGYKYGQAWLARAVPEDVLAELRRLGGGVDVP